MRYIFVCLFSILVLSVTGLVNLPAESISDQGVNPRLNLLFITLDTLRSDHLGCYGNPKVDTFACDSLARTGWQHLNAVTTAPRTLPAHASMFTGLYPFNHTFRMAIV